MGKNEEFTLISGCFSALDAKEILLTLLQDKINFHERRNFSQFEMTGEKDLYSLGRIKELEKCKKRIAVLVDNAAEFGLDLNIQSSIVINFDLMDK